MPRRKILNCLEIEEVRTLEILETKMKILGKGDYSGDCGQDEILCIVGIGIVNVVKLDGVEGLQ